MRKHEPWHTGARWMTPFQPAAAPWISQAEIVARIDAIRAQEAFEGVREILEPFTLPLGRLTERPVLTRRAS